MIAGQRLSSDILCAQVLKDCANQEVAKELKAAVGKIPDSHAEPALAECRAVVMKVILSLLLGTLRVTHLSFPDFAS